MVPLDGMCRFSLPEDRPVARPVGKIHNLLHPQRIGILNIALGNPQSSELVSHQIR